MISIVQSEINILCEMGKKELFSLQVIITLYIHKQHSFRHWYFPTTCWMIWCLCYFFFFRENWYFLLHNFYSIVCTDSISERVSKNFRLSNFFLQILATFNLWHMYISYWHYSLIANTQKVKHKRYLYQSSVFLSFLFYVIQSNFWIHFGSAMSMLW